MKITNKNLNLNVSPNACRLEELLKILISISVFWGRLMQWKYNFLSPFTCAEYAWPKERFVYLSLVKILVMKLFIVSCKQQERIRERYREYWCIGRGWTTYCAYLCKNIIQRIVIQRANTKEFGLSLICIRFVSLFETY